MSKQGHSSIHATRGTLISSDVPTIAFIKYINEKHRFVIEELDERNIFVETNSIKLIEDLLEKEQESNTWTMDKEALRKGKDNNTKYVISEETRPSKKTRIGKKQ